MALFGKKKDAVTVEKTVSVKAGLATDRNLAAVLVRPHLTEKAVGLGDSNVYTFEVARSATKFAVRDAIKVLYNVTPVKVNIVNKLPAKRRKGSTGRMVKQPCMKKAYVYLKKGDTINLV